MLNRTAYRCVVVGLLLTMMGVLTGLFSPGQSDTDLGVVSNQVHIPFLVVMVVLYALLLWNLVSAPMRYLRSMAAQWTLLPLLGFCILSAAWSGDPSLTARRALILAVTMLIAVVIGTDFSVAEIGRMLAAASLLHLGLCVVFFAVAPHYLFAPEDAAALKGLTTHKNVFGFEQGLAVLVMWFCPFHRLRAFRVLFVALAAGALVWSHSSGALIATLAAMSLSPLLSVSRLQSKERVPIAVLVVIVAAAIFAVIAANLNRIPALFSKDATLTGRTELWDLVLVAIRTHLWLGFGFDSFWRGLEGDSLSIIRSVGWLVPTAHNGYLDLLLSVGVVGAVLFAVPLFLFVYRAVLQTVQGIGSDRLLPLMLLLFLLVYNLNESALLTRSGLPFFLIIALTTAMTRQLAGSRAAYYSSRSQDRFVSAEAVYQA